MSGGAESPKTRAGKLKPSRWLLALVVLLLIPACAFAFVGGWGHYFSKESLPLETADLIEVSCAGSLFVISIFSVFILTAGLWPGRLAGPKVILIPGGLLVVCLAVLLIMGEPISSAHVRVQYLLGKPDPNEADLSGAKLRFANLQWANLRDADLSEADLRQASLSGADLHEADLHMANLAGANLAGANLRWANLSHANLRWADLSEADLHGADLHRTDLRLADLEGAKVTDEQLAEAESLEGATLPDGTVHE